MVYRETENRRPHLPEGTESPSKVQRQPGHRKQGFRESFLEEVSFGLIQKDK